MTQALPDYTAAQLIRSYRKKELSPVEVTQAILERIAEWDTHVNAFVRIDNEGRDARAAGTTTASGNLVGLVPAGHRIDTQSA